jgi:putative PIN family toxin of toxin-antitoxin system
MRLVLDTNVVFSALLWQGMAHQFLQTVRATPSIQLFSSMPLIEELADVFTRKESVKRLALLGRSADAVLADYVMAVHLVEPTPITATSIDPDDDVVLATALAARADAIISGDRKHLLVLQEFQGIPILAPAQAIAFINAG